jgi:phosphate/sulfate permease
VRKTLKNIAVEYGSVAVVVYLAIFALALVGFWAAIRFGWSSSSTAANVGAWTAAYIATKLTQPLRIVATVAVTPLIARIFSRTRSAPPS